MGENWNGKCIEAQPSRNHVQRLEYNLIKRLKPNTEASNNSWVLTLNHASNTQSRIEDER